MQACSHSNITQIHSDGRNVVLAEEAPIDSSTSDEEEVDRPDGWDERTHGTSGEPDYDTVFPQDDVNRIDIIIEPDDWQVMLDDMTALYGDFGSRPEQEPAL